MIRLVRVMRILRVFKMVRHFVGLQSIIYTLHEAWKELGIIMLVVTITMLIFSSLLFAFEQSGPIAESWLFYDCIMWSLLTLSTVGYHLQPQTTMGQILCGLCAMCGM